MDTLPSEFYFKYEVVVKAFERLIDIMSCDLGLLKNANSALIEERLGERIDLVNFLTLQRTMLSKNSNVIDSLTTEQKKHLASLSTKLTEVAEVSQREISKAMFVNEKLLSVLAKAVKGAKRKSLGYSNLGKTAARNFADTPHIALNKKY